MNLPRIFSMHTLVYRRMLANNQGLTVVNFSAQHKHFWWDTSGTFSR